MAKARVIPKEYERFREIIDVMSTDINQWKINYEMYNNKRFTSSDTDDQRKFDNFFKYIVKLNKIKSDVHRIANTLKDNKPRVIVRPKTNSQDDITKAEYLQNFITAFFKKNGLFDDTLIDIHVRRLLYGTVGVYSGYLKNGNKLEYGIRVLSPFEFFFAPDIENYEDHKYCYMLSFVEKEEQNSTYFDNLKFEFYEPERYDIIIDYFERNGKHLRFNSSGEVLLNEENPYGERLPIVYSYYYYRPRKYYGYGVVDELRVPQSVFNILVSKMVDGALKSGLVGFAPLGAISEDVNIGSGEIIKYDVTVTGQNNMPQIQNIEGIPQSLIAMLSVIQELYSSVAPIYSVETGNLPSYSSGSSKQTEFQIASASRSFSFLTLDAMFTRVALNIINDINNDVFEYFSAKEMFEYINDEEKKEIYKFSNLKTTEADIVVAVSDNIPVDAETLGTVAFTMMLERAKNPSDYEANKFLEELYRRYGLKYISNRNRDIVKAREENEIIMQILESKISDTDIQYYLNATAQGMGIDQIAEMFDAEEIVNIRTFFELVNKIDPKPYDNHLTHLDVHYDIVKSPEFLKYSPAKRMVIEEMIKKHMQMAGGTWSEPGSPINAATQRLMKKIEQTQPSQASQSTMPPEQQAGQAPPEGMTPEM